MKKVCPDDVRAKVAERPAETANSGDNGYTHTEIFSGDRVHCPDARSSCPDRGTEVILFGVLRTRDNKNHEKRTMVLSLFLYPKTR